MKPETRALLENAGEALQAGSNLIDDGLLADAVSRLYYSMFYVAEALLIEEGFQFKSHSAVRSVFGERFARTGRIDRRFHRALLEAFRARQRADYDIIRRVDEAQAREMLSDAEDLLAAALALLEGTSA